MSSEHTLLELKKTNPIEDSRGEQSKKHSREASSPERVRDIVEGETVPTEVCSDVEKDLRVVDVLNPLFVTQKEGATPKKVTSPSPKKMEDKTRKEANPCQNQTFHQKAQKRKIYILKMKM